MGKLSHASLGAGAELSPAEWVAEASHKIGGVANLDVVTTAETQTLTGKTLTSPTIQGTVTPGTGLTMPAFTMIGEFNLSKVNARAYIQNTVSGQSFQFYCQPVGATSLFMVNQNAKQMAIEMDFTDLACWWVLTPTQGYQLAFSIQAGIDNPVLHLYRTKFYNPIDANSQAITSVAGISLVGDVFLNKTLGTGRLQLSGGLDSDSAFIMLYGKSHASFPGLFQIATPNAALAYTARFQISGAVATAVATWSDITHSGLNITSGQVLKVANTQVVSAQGAAVADVTDGLLATTITQLNALLARVRAHGLIAP